MEKMEGKTIDIVADNIAKLKALFPEAVTEGKIDFDVLKELLGEYVEDRDERYSFTWNGKSKARMLAQTPSTGTLRPCPEESVNWETTKNIFIEGDNLEVLKLLQKSYHKKIKVICIDPPYNTGHDFVYKDDFKDNINNYKLITGQIDGEGRNISSNPETSGRYHTDWLNMMYPRLKLARNLLKDDGVIFISIDDNEASNLKKICDDIFGEENFVADFVWQRKYGASNNSKGVAPMIDHIFCYSKTTEFVVGRFPRSQEATERYKNPDGDHRGPWKAVDYWNPLSPGERPNLAYTITNPFTGKEIIPEKKAWKYSQEKYFEHATDNRIYWGKDGTNTVPTLKRFLSEVDDGVTPTNFWDWKFASHTDAAKKILNDLGVIGFSTPKPPLLIERMLQVSSTNEDDLILDFFAGSATTVHAVMQFNVKKNGNCRYVMVQLPEATNEKSEACEAGYKTVADIGKERIRRAAAKIKKEYPEFKGDLGFKVFKLDSTNIKPWEADFETLDENLLEDYITNIKPGRTESDILYEVLLKYGLDLTLPIKEHTIAGQKVFDIGMGALIICLSDAVDLDVVEGIAGLKEKLEPEIMRVVFKDSGFADDVVKTNAVQILKQAGIEDVRSL